jgi:hypothetical protein
LGIKTKYVQPQHPPKQARRNKGRKSNNIALQELGALLINSSKIKKIFPNSPPACLNEDYKLEYKRPK